MNTITTSNKAQTDLEHQDAVKCEEYKETQTLESLLLTAPTLTDEEVQEFGKVREWMNQWNVNDQ